MSGARARIWGLFLVLGTLGGCGETFGSHHAPGPAILPPEALAAKSIKGCAAGQLRVLRPGQGLTRDLMPDRLNVQIDGNGIVLRMFCG